MATTKTTRTFVMTPLLLLCLAVVSQAQGPRGLQLRQCEVTNKVTLSQCLYNTLEEIRPVLAQGYPQWDIPKLEPAFLDKIVFSQTEGPIDLRATFKNVKVQGLSKYNTTNIEADPNSSVLRTAFYFPELYVTGDYNLDGKILLLPVTGSGDFWARLTRVTSKGQSVMKIVTNANGEERFRVTNSHVDFSFQDVNIRLNNLFNGDPILGETVNHFLNTNSEEILSRVRPEVSRQLNNLVETVTNNAFGNLPVSAFIKRN
ncbi:protein takeout-like [Oratosquilla oratoria]|uniref:protein takeout-like n=1 Tax=Oratosquilla oratoria TaxID=337810 RepID=UPI003F7666D2